MAYSAVANCGFMSETVVSVPERPERPDRIARRVRFRFKRNAEKAKTCFSDFGVPVVGRPNTIRSGLMEIFQNPIVKKHEKKRTISIASSLESR